MPWLARIGFAGCAFALTITAVACTGDDDTDSDDAGRTEAEQAAAEDAEVDDPASFCDPFFAVQGPLFETPEDPAEGATYVAETLVPLVDDLEANATPATEEVIIAFADKVRSAVTPEGFERVTAEFEGGPIYQYLTEIQLAAADSCGYQRIDVDALDYAFSGMPTDLEAGMYAVVLTNTASGEMHEIGLVQPKDDGKSLDDVLALGPEDQESAVEMLGFAFAPPGQTAVAFIEISEGPLYYACFIPVGGEDDGAPHFTEGMKGEATVS